MNVNDKKDGMNAIDKLVCAVAPAAGYRRLAYREAIGQARSMYDAADGDRLNSGWRVVNGSAEHSAQANRDIIRARSRDLEQNSDIQRSLLSALERNVIGVGLKLQVHATDDNAINEQIEALFDRWRRARNCDLLGIRTLEEMTRMILRRKWVDGGILIVKRYVPGRIVPFCIQLLEVDELDAGSIAPKYKANKVSGGIEYNRFGQREGYWVRQYDIDGNRSMQPIFLPAEDVIFYANMERPSQRREIGQLAATIPRVRDINQFMEAVSVKERIAACLSVFVKKAVPGPGVGRSQLYDKKSGYNGVRLTPGMVQEMQPGDEVQVVNPANQGGGATDFVRLQQRLAGSGNGLSYEAISRDLSQVNYSSARQGLIEDEAIYGIERKAIIDHVLVEIYREFLLSAVLSGAIKLPGYTGDITPFTDHRWIAPAKRWIDPYKEARADDVALINGTKTFEEICSENGRDWREVLVQLADEKRLKIELGLLEGSVADEKGS